MSNDVTGRPTVRPSDRSGIALLDVLVALTILSTSGLELVALLRQAVQAQTAVAAAERTLDAADRVMAALTLLGRADLDRRIGQQEIGEFVADIQRPEPRLYRVALAQSTAPERILLVTVVYRAESRPND